LTSLSLIFLDVKERKKEVKMKNGQTSSSHHRPKREKE
jgi:hypothetical protein